MRPVGSTALLAAATAAALSGCTASGTSATHSTSALPSQGSSTSIPVRPSTASGSVAVVHHPLHLPTIRPGQRCPVTLSRRQPDPALGIVQGLGPAGPVGLSAHGVLHYGAPNPDRFVDRSWGGQKVLWAVDNSVDGAVLVRGRQLDGPHRLGFNDPALPELVLEPKPVSHPGGWRDYPSYTRLRAPGCYAYQVDTPSRSFVIVFRADGPSLRR